MEVVKKKTKRLLIGIAGGFLLVIGILAIPYPGPGWLIVFTALAILATEFPWARRVLDFVRARYDKWRVWLRGQHPVLRAVFVLLTGVVVLGTLWLLNMFGLIDNLLNLQQQWLHSPFDG